MRALLAALAATTFSAVLALGVAGGASSARTSAPVPARPAGSARDIPLLFHADGSDGVFRARGHGYDVTVTRAGATLQLRNADRVELAFDGAGGGRLAPERPLATRINFLRGPRKSWRTGVATYGAVRATQISPGIDAVFYGTDGNLEYDLIVAPGASPRALGLTFNGADALVARDGELRVRVGDRWLTQRPAVAYQTIAGTRVPVAVRYRTDGRRVAFDVQQYDATRPLVIDPVLSFSTYFGATSADAAAGIAADAAGNAYVVGTASYSDLPGPVARPHTQPEGGSSGDTRDAYVAKFHADGSVEWVSYFGGSLWTLGSAVAVGPDNDVYLAGETDSADFPTTPGAFNPAAPAMNQEDEFVLRLAPDGTTLRYSTMLGAPQGRWNGNAAAIAVDAQGRAVVAGTTGSPSFPVTMANGHSPQPPGINNTDGFVARLSADGARLDFGRLLGGSLNDVATALTLDKNGAVYVVGDTLSTDFPVLNALHPSHFGPTDPDGEYGMDGFLAYIWNDGSLSFSTYLGGNDEDHMTAVVQGLYGRVYVGGETKTEGLGRYAKPSPAGVLNGIIFEIAPNGSSQINALYTYATSQTRIDAMTVTRDGKWLWILGDTEGVGWSYGGYPDQPAQGHPGGGGDLFLQKMSSTFDTIDYSDLYGGSGNEAGTGISLNPTGDVYISGTTTSPDYPLKNPVQTTIEPAGAGDFGPSGDGVVTTFACDFHETGPTPTQTAGGGDGQTRTLIEDGCVPDIVSDAPWLHVTGYSSTSVTFHADANTTSSARTGHLTISNRDTAFVSQDAAPGSGGPTGTPEIVLNAADASVIRGTWALATDPMHGQIITQPDAGAQKIANPFENPPNYFEFTFSADAGVPYHLWIHGRAQNDSWQNDSVWVQFSDAVDRTGTPQYQIGTSSGTFVSLEPCGDCGEQGWGWRDNQYGGGGAPNIVFATSGTHTIRLQQREDGFAIGQVVLSSQTYLSTAPGPDRNDTTVVQKPAGSPPPATDEIALWPVASNAIVHGTWRAVADASGAGGGSLHNPDNAVPKLVAPSASPANYFDITFNADAGKPYHLWLRMKADGDAYQNDSVWVQFSGSTDSSGAPAYRIGTTSGTFVSLEECSGCGEQGWGWQNNAYGTAGDLGPNIYFAQSGPQTIRIQTREDGLALDQIVLSAVKYATHAPGVNRNDTTIVPKTQ